MDIYKHKKTAHPTERMGSLALGFNSSAQKGKCSKAHASDKRIKEELGSVAGFRQLARVRNRCRGRFRSQCGYDGRSGSRLDGRSGSRSGSRRCHDPADEERAQIEDLDQNAIIHVGNGILVEGFFDVMPAVIMRDSKAKKKPKETNSFGIIAN